MNFAEQLQKLNACSPAIQWVQKTSGTPREAWEKCDRPNWMLWILARVAPKTDFAELACQFAEMSLQYLPAGEDRPAKTIRAALDYRDGKISRQQLVNVRSAAGYDAAYAAAYAAAAYDAVCRAMRQKQADIIRELCPFQDSWLEKLPQ